MTSKTEGVRIGWSTRRWTTDDGLSTTACVPRSRAQCLGAALATGTRSCERRPTEEGPPPHARTHRRKTGARAGPSRESGPPRPARPSAAWQCPRGKSGLAASN